MTAVPTLPLTGHLVDPSQRLTFTFNGKPISALGGQSVAAALYAHGVRVFTRSFKYHRPRGLFCVAGDCPNCLMQVDGVPNVRTCVEPVRPGQVVRHQNAWPSLGFDVLRVFDTFHRFLPVGFYYKSFHKPRWLWPIFEHTVRHIAGLGQVDVRARPNLDKAVEHLDAEVCVVGGGPAGLAAANEAGEAGADVLLLERQQFLGGRRLLEGRPPEELGSASARRRTLLGTTAFGLYEGHLLGAVQGDRLLKIRARRIIVCTGGRQQPLLFPNNDLAGIMLGDGVLRLAHLYGVRAGTRAVVVGDNVRATRLADRLKAIGIEIALVVAAADVRRACGNHHLTAIRVARADGSEHEVPCDLLCLASPRVPANELLLQGGMRFRLENGCWRPDRDVPGLSAAGGAAGVFDDEPAPLGSQPIVNGVGKTFVCQCEDVTVKDIDQAVAEGFDHIETLKRYATVGMGPCQGKMCSLTATALCGRATGRDLNTIGVTTSRPPAVPVELAVLAADRRHHPVRRTPLHHWHQAHGARWIDAGQWKRPEHYGDPTAEVQAVRNVVGLIDVSTLGKIEVVGPDAAELLERVYVNRWADLKIGRVRYGVMCTEEGVLFDDGVVARLADDRFYLTATTGNADAIVQWLELWKTTWRLNVTVLSQTSGVAAMNLAGPRARDVLARLTTIDVSPGAFPYLALREGDVAGVPCRLLRIGFVGELGYEIHCPSAYAEALWLALHQVGAEFGLKPFGVEAQRVLRLEKGHLIVGVDTDALATPLDAGLEGMVRFEKPLFHGRETLLRLRQMGPRQRLVGFVMEEPIRVPPEGSQVVEGGAPVGRITSARHSPTQGRSLGLAWVPVKSAPVGSRFQIRVDGVDVSAVVAELPFYDVAGQRLRM